MRTLYNRRVGIFNKFEVCSHFPCSFFTLFVRTQSLLSFSCKHTNACTGQSCNSDSGSISGIAVVTASRCMHVHVARCIVASTTFVFDVHRHTHGETRPASKPRLSSSMVGVMKLEIVHTLSWTSLWIISVGIRVPWTRFTDIFHCSRVYRDPDSVDACGCVGNRNLHRARDIRISGY